MGHQQIYDAIYDDEEYLEKRKFNKNSLSSTLSRMKRNGLLERKNNKWIISKAGRELLNKEDNVKKFDADFHLQKKKQKQVIVTFDIPEKKKKYREWLRMELINFGFEMVQKSVWFGPSLPKEFISYLDENDLLKYIRFFKATERDLV